MAKLIMQKLGKLRGSIGNVVFYQLNGETVMRRKPGPRKTKPTPRQLYTRKAFNLGQLFLKPLIKELNFTFSEFIRGPKRGFHFALSTLLKTAISNRQGKPVLDPILVQISSGELDPLTDASLEKIGDTKFRLSWNANTWIGTPREGDRLYLLVYCPEEKLFFAIREGAFRKNELQEFDIPWLERVSSKTYCYAAFYKKVPKGIRFSDSVCLGIGE